MYQIKHTINIILTLWYFSFGKVFVRLLQNFLVRFGRLEFQCVTPEGERKEKVPLELHHSHTFHAWMRNCTYGCDSPLPDGILRTASLVHYGLIHILPTSEKKRKETMNDKRNNDRS